MNIKEKIMTYSLSAYKNVMIAKISALIALGSMIILFIIMYATARPSFVTLIFLVISVTSLFRASEISGVIILHDLAKKLLQTVGLICFVVTVVLSFRWNYVNSTQWDHVVQAIIKDNKNPVVLEIESMPCFPNITQLVGKINSHLRNSAEIWYGAHVIIMPVFFEGCYHNTIIPQYYGIKKTTIERKR